MLDCWTADVADASSRQLHRKAMKQERSQVKRHSDRTGTERSQRDIRKMENQSTNDADANTFSNRGANASALAADAASKKAIMVMKHRRGER